jgi:hypothetical protein
LTIFLGEEAFVFVGELEVEESVEVGASFDRSFGEENPRDAEPTIESRCSCHGGIGTRVTAKV